MITIWIGSDCHINWKWLPYEEVITWEEEDAWSYHGFASEDDQHAFAVQRRFGPKTSKITAKPHSSQSQGNSNFFYIFFDRSVIGQSVLNIFLRDNVKLQWIIHIINLVKLVGISDFYQFSYFLPAYVQNCYICIWVFISTTNILWNILHS